MGKTRYQSASVLDKFMSALSPEQRNNIELVSADGARWIKKCVSEWLPNAELCIDGFHVVSWAIEALDTLRKDVKKQIKLKESIIPSMPVGRPANGVTVSRPTPARVFKSTQYALGKNPDNLTSTQSSILDEIRKTNPVLYRGYLLKERLRAVFQCTGNSVEFEH